MNKRACTAITVVTGTTVGASDAIDINSYAWGFIYVPTGQTLVTLTFYVAPSPAGTFLPAFDSTPTAIVKTVANGNAYPFPTVLFGAGAVKIVSDVAGSIIVTLKS